MAASFLACGALWLVPESWGSGNLLRAAERAHSPNPGSPAFAAVPFLEVFRRSLPVLMPPVLLGAAIALVRAWRARNQPARRAGDRAEGEGGAMLRAEGERGAMLRLALGAVAAALMLVVAAMTQAGFAGNLRYVALPAALVAVLAGAGWVEPCAAARRFGRPAGAGLALLAAVASRRSSTMSTTGWTTTGS